jgi:hypothetical protein
MLIGPAIGIPNMKPAIIAAIDMLKTLSTIGCYKRSIKVSFFTISLNYK